MHIAEIPDCLGGWTSFDMVCVPGVVIVRSSVLVPECIHLYISALSKHPQLECGPDGGLSNSRGTSGVVLAVKDRVLWEVAGRSVGQ